MANTALTLGDLWQKCEECGGSGTLGPGVMYGGAVQIASIDCPKCQGTKGTPTATGQALLEFLALAKPSN